MQAIVIKYIQLFCVAVLFDNVSCDQLRLKNYKDDLLFYQTTSCAASCLRDFTNKVSTKVLLCKSTKVTRCCVYLYHIKQLKESKINQQKVN